MLLGLIITACGAPDRVMRTGISDEMRPVISEFLKDCERLSTDKSHCNLFGLQSAKFVTRLDASQAVESVSINAVGLCLTWDDGTTTLQVLRSFCEGQPYICRAVVYHELGHCVLKRGHEEHGLMAPVAMSESDYMLNWDNIIELFFKGEIR
jgi:hypothetical protein